MKNLHKFGPANRPNQLNDFLFYKTMGEKGDEVQLLGFLNAVLGRKGKEHIESVEIVENRAFVTDVMNGKSCALDIRAVLADGTKVNVEVQLRNEDNMDRRSLFYWNKLYSKGFKKGQDYRELPNVVVINIVDYDFLPSENFHTCFHLREDDEPSLVLTPALEIHFVNMVKWRRWHEKNVLGDPLQRWLVWFDPASPPELIAEVVRMDSAIMAAEEKQIEFLVDDETSELYWRRQMALMDERAARAFARNEGLSEGRTEASREIAQKMKAMGLSPEQIQAATGVSLE